MWDTGLQVAGLNRGWTAPNEDFDEARPLPQSGAARAVRAIVQPGTGWVPCEPPERDHNKLGESARANRKPSRGRVVRRAGRLEENSWPKMPRLTTYQPGLRNGRTAPAAGVRTPLARVLGTTSGACSMPAEFDGGQRSALHPSTRPTPSGSAGARPPRFDQAAATATATEAATEQAEVAQPEPVQSRRSPLPSPNPSEPGRCRGAVRPPTPSWSATTRVAG